MSHYPLTQTDLLAEGPLLRLGSSLHWLRDVSSTNAFLLDAAEHLADGAIAWAEHQSAGRGRRGRRWEAPRGASILLSVLLRERLPSVLVEEITLAAALAARAAVERTTACPVQLRWPNDLYVGPRKLGGVLAESRPLSDGSRGLVVGVGINCLQHAGHFPEEIRDRATSLDLECSTAVRRGPVAAALLAELDRCVQSPDRAAWQRQWREVSADLGTRVEVLEDGRAFSGTVVDLIDGGHLVLQLDRAGRRAFSPQTTSRGG